MEVAAKLALALRHVQFVSLNCTYLLEVFHPFAVVRVWMCTTARENLQTVFVSRHEISCLLEALSDTEALCQASQQCRCELAGSLIVNLERRIHSNNCRNSGSDEGFSQGLRMAGVNHHQLHVLAVADKRFKPLRVHPVDHSKIMFVLKGQVVLPQAF